MNIAILFGRKNSKSIRNKNILKIFSKPMFMYPLSAAKKVKQIDKIYQTAIKNGAVGGKLLGAGKSGYFVFFSRRKFHKKITVSLKKLNLKLENLRIENEGIKFWRKF